MRQAPWHDKGKIKIWIIHKQSLKACVVKSYHYCGSATSWTSSYMKCTISSTPEIPYTLDPSKNRSWWSHIWERVQWIGRVSSSGACLEERFHQREEKAGRLSTAGGKPRHWSIFSTSSLTGLCPLTYPTMSTSPRPAGSDDCGSGEGSPTGKLFQ